VLACALQPLSAAEQRADDHYTVFVELRQPYESNRAALQKMLKAEGYESFSEREQEISLVLTAAQIAKLFQGKVRQRMVEKSATSGLTPQPVLEGVRIPARFEKLIRRAYFDPQRS
jgi:hypothetical protein